jgi:signal transduction histidine kinase
MRSDKIPLDLKKLDFIELIYNSIEELRPFLNEKKQYIMLELPDGPFMIYGDRIRLSQVITNLLNNANKFTPEGGTIALSMIEKDSLIQVQISDTGIGIQKEDLERVFQPFTKIRKPTYVKGTGLGLSVTKAIVETHGGQVWAFSEGEGKGATFTFTLPKHKIVEAS